MRPDLRRRLIWAGVALVSLILVTLVLLAIPFRGVQGDAQAARVSLEDAVAAVSDGDTDAAAKHAEAARKSVDDVRGVTEGVSGRVWSWVPVAGTSVRDVRHLGTTLHEVTAALEEAVAVLPKVTGPDATLMSGQKIDLEVLNDLIPTVDSMEDRLTRAREALEKISGEGPVIGDSVIAARDEVTPRLVPVQETLGEMAPFIHRLPAVLGEDEKKTYALALLNPAEMRYSGGTPLTLSRLVLEDGEIRRGRVEDVATQASVFRLINWEGVEDNPFHAPYRQRITHSTIAPSWPVAGEEFLRAWARLKGREADGVIVLDVVTLARLLSVTGPLDIPGAGEVTADTLVPSTIGSYDQFDEAESARRQAINRALIPLFVDKLFGGADMGAILRNLHTAAQHRHFAVYFRDEVTQDGVARLGWDGDLAPADHDYVGVFTQNLVAAKSDYWQRKDLRSKVRLRPDGSAKVRLDATIHNTATPIPFDPRSGYHTRWITMNIGAFLPSEARVRSARLGDETFTPEMQTYFDRQFLERQVEIGPGEEVTLRLNYVVPSAATVEDDESLTYRLGLDPHPTVQDAGVRVKVRWPDGMEPTDLPEGWVAQGVGGAVYKVDTHGPTATWEIRSRR